MNRVGREGGKEGRREARRGRPGIRDTLIIMHASVLCMYHTVNIMGF